MIANCVYNCVVILECFQKLGYDGKITILKDYVRPFRPAKRGRSVRRYETIKINIKSAVFWDESEDQCKFALVCVKWRADAIVTSG